MKQKFSKSSHFVIFELKTSADLNLVPFLIQFGMELQYEEKKIVLKYWFMNS